MIIAESDLSCNNFFKSKESIEQYCVAAYQYEFRYIMEESTTHLFLGDVIKNSLMLIFMAQKKDFKDSYERTISKSEKSGQLAVVGYKLEQIYRVVMSLQFIGSPNLYATSLREGEKVSLNAMAQYIINLSDHALLYSCVFAKNKSTCLFLLAHKFDENSTVNQSKFANDLAKIILSFSFQENLETIDRNRIIPKSCEWRLNIQ